MSYNFSWQTHNYLRFSRSFSIHCPTFTVPGDFNRSSCYFAKASDEINVIIEFLQSEEISNLQQKSKLFSSAYIRRYIESKVSNKGGVSCLTQEAHVRNWAQLPGCLQTSIRPLV